MITKPNVQYKAWTPDAIAAAQKRIYDMRDNHDDLRKVICDAHIKMTLSEQDRKFMSAIDGFFETPKQPIDVIHSALTSPIADKASFNMLNLAIDMATEKNDKDSLHKLLQIKKDYIEELEKL
jgi:hypothetical protein